MSTTKQIAGTLLRKGQAEFGWRQKEARGVAELAAHAKKLGLSSSVKGTSKTAGNDSRPFISIEGPGFTLQYIGGQETLQVWYEFSNQSLQQEVTYDWFLSQTPESIRNFSELREQWTTGSAAIRTQLNQLKSHTRAALRAFFK